MCKVYEFPVAKKLPQELEERLEKLAKELVELIDDSIEYFLDEDASDEELAELGEALMGVYSEAIANAVEELEF